MPDIIVYDTIYEVLRKEKYNPEIQKLDKDFFKNIVKYLEEKQKILLSQQVKESIFSGEAEKTKIQLENFKKILKELYEKRENKIIQLAILSSRIKEKPPTAQSLLPEEQKFLKSLSSILNSYRKNILSTLLNAQLPSITEEKIEADEEPKSIKTDTKETEQAEKVKILRFTTPVPKFIGDDLNIYGPFTNEDISSVPEKTASLLIKKNRAEEIKIETA